MARHRTRGARHAPEEQTPFALSSKAILTRLGGSARHAKLEPETSMTNANQTQEIQTDEIETATKKRSCRVETAAYLAGFSALIGFVMLPRDATFGTGIAFVGIAGMVAVACYFILRAR